MAVTVSVTLDAVTQKDGRRYARETYSDATGVCQIIDYLAASGADTSAIATARLADIANRLADKEAEDLVQIDLPPVFRFQTGAQFLDRLRVFYKIATNVQLAKLARYVINRINDGSATVLQLRTAWGLTLANWNTLQTKMQALRDDLNVIEAGVGE